MTDNSEHKHQYYLAVIPVLGYVCMMAYEAGRFSYLGVSPEYLELTSQRIAELAVITFIAVLGLATLLNFLFALSESSRRWEMIVGRVLLWLVVLSVPVIVFVSDKLQDSVMAISALIAATYELTARRGHANASRLRKSINRLAGSYLWMVLSAGFITALFYRAGEISQEFDETALVLQDSPESMVIGQYAGNLLIKVYEPKTGRLEKCFRLQAGDGVHIVEARTGRLH